MKLIGKSLKIEHIIIVLIATMYILAVSCITCNATEIVDSGECGESLGTVTWTLDDEGTLTISGNGNMADFRINDFNSAWKKYSESIITIQIEDGVKNVSENAFYKCSNLSRAVLADSVIIIGFSAFGNCSNLNEVILPDSMELIESTAFYSCTNLTDIELPEGITKINYRTFYNCRSLTSVSIPDSVTAIDESAFDSCKSLETAKLSENLTTIGERAFYGCEELVCAIPESVTRIGKYAFWGCDITSLTISDGMTVIEDGSFMYCSKLQTVSISQSVISIGAGAFENCTGLTDIAIPDSVKTIGNRAFSGCTGLKSISLPEGLESVEYAVFSNCKSLENITIPDGVKSIGSNAFYECHSLKKISIPDSITSFGNAAFMSCGVEDINMPDNLMIIGDNVFNNCRELTYISLPEGLESIGIRAFQQCNGLTSITIPDSVTNIGESAFTGCSNLKEIIIGNGEITIGDKAFLYCNVLEQATIGRNVVSIGAQAIGLTEQNGSFIPKEGFVINGYTGTVAETYANENSIPFVAIDGDDPYDPGEQLDYLSQLKLSARIVADSDSDEDETKLIYKNGKYENEIPVTVKLYCNIPHNFVPAAEDSEKPHQYTYDELEALGVTVNVSDLKLSLDDSLADKCQIVFEDGSGGAGEAYYGETITVRPKDRLSIHATLRGKDGSAPAEITTENELNVAATYQVCAESGQATDDARSGGSVKFTTVNVDKGREAYAPSDFVKPSVRMMYTNIIASGRPANESTAVYKDGAFDHDSFTIEATLTVKNVENDFYTEQELDAAGVTYSADYLEFESSETRAVLSSGSQSGSDIKVYNSDFNNLKSGDSHEVPLTLKINESCLPNSAGDRMLVTAKILDKNSGKTISCGTAKLNITNRDYTKRKVEEQKADDPDNAELAVRNALKVDRTINVANFPNLMFLSDSEQEAVESVLKMWLAETALAIEAKGDKSFSKELQKYCSDKVFDKCLSYLNVNANLSVIGIRTIEGKYDYTVKTKEYGDVTVLFELKMDPLSASGSVFAATGTVKCTVYGDKINEDVIGTYNGIEAPVTYANTRALADHIKKMAIATAHSCYPSGMGSNIDALVDESVEVLFLQPLYKTLRIYGVSFPGTQFHAVINLMEEGYNEHLVRCPVDVYVYNSCGDLVGAIVDDVVDPAYDTVNMFVEDGEKKIILSDDDYHLKLTGNDDGTMDYDVTAYGADGSVKRQVQYRNVPITRGESWETNSPENPDAEQLQLSLISSEYGTVLKPDEDVKAEVEPEVYGLVLDACEKECPEGGTINIKATLISNVAAEDLPQGQDGIVWSSSNENAAVVNSKGEVTGKALGESIITASYGDGRFVARCLVKVVEKQDEPDNPDEPHQHVFGPWATTKAATEIAAGLQTRKCSECGYAERRTVAQLAPTLPAVKITKAAGGKKSATVKWKKISAKNRKKIKKVEIQYSTDRNFRTGVKTKYAGAKKTSYKIKGLKKGKKYYVRIRAYTKAGTAVHVSKWSKSKSAKVK